MNRKKIILVAAFVQEHVSTSVDMSRKIHQSYSVVNTNMLEDRDEHGIRVCCGCEETQLTQPYMHMRYIVHEYDIILE